jgi:prepilin-type N-terminal cleavage/methylation domain-containing protein
MFKIIRSEKGFSLVEVLIAVAILGIIGVAFAMGLFATSKNVLLSDNKTTGESLARTLMEDVKEAPYANDYNPDVNIYVEFPAEFADLGYSVIIAEPETLVAGLQKITITIYHNGEEEDNTVYVLEGYKSSR